MAPIKYGPNTVITDEEVEKRKRALRNISDDEIRKCKQLLLEEGKSLTVLVVGETGAGKSTLINALLGKDVAAVGCGPARVTQTVKHYTGHVGEVDITVVEVPELDMDGIREHRQEMRRCCPNGVDVVYVCQKMYDRHRPSAIETLRHLSVVFEREIHKKAVFVMTFANEIPKSWGHEMDTEVLQKKFERVWSDLDTIIRDRLVGKLRMSHKEVEKAMVLPAGYYEKDDPENSQQILGVTSNWINDLLLASAITASLTAPAILRVMAEGVKNSTGGNECGKRFCGYVSGVLEAISKCLVDLHELAFEKIHNLVKKVALTLFTAVTGIVEAAGQVFTAMCRCGGVTPVDVGAWLSIAVASYVVGSLSAVIVVGVVGVIVSVILAVLGGIALGVVSGATTGATLGAIVGAVVGTVLFPGVGTSAGAGIGATVGAALGGSIGGVAVYKHRKA